MKLRYVVDLDPSKPRGERIDALTFVPVDARPMLTLDVRVEPGADPTAVVVGAIEKYAHRQSVRPELVEGLHAGTAPTARPSRASG